MCLQYFRHCRSNVSIRCVQMFLIDVRVCHVWLCLHVVQRIASRTSNFVVKKIQCLLRGFMCVYNKNSSTHNKLLMCVSRVVVFAWASMHFQCISNVVL